MHKEKPNLHSSNNHNTDFSEIEANLKNLYISLKYKINSDKIKLNENEFKIFELEKLKRLDLNILVNYLKEMIEIYSDFRIEKSIMNNNRNFVEKDFDIMNLSFINNDVEIPIEEKSFDCLTIKNEKNDDFDNNREYIKQIKKSSNSNWKNKEYVEYERLIQKLEAEIRERIKVN